MWSEVTGVMIVFWHPVFNGNEMVVISLIIIWEDAVVSSEDVLPITTDSHAQP